MSAPRPSTIAGRRAALVAAARMEGLFTRDDVWHAVGGSRSVHWQIVVHVVKALIDEGSVVVTNPGHKPHLLRWVDP